MILSAIMPMGTIFVEKIMQRTIQEAADICGILPDAIEQAAEWIGRQKGSCLSGQWGLISQ
jgi:anaerobic selenocysteine-containing dehydrogenase